MNTTCDISSSNKSHSFSLSACNNNGTDNGLKMGSVLRIVTFLLSFPTNSYVIWLIVKGIGNGLAAEFFIFNLAVCEIVYCFQCLLSYFFSKIEIVKKLVGFLDGLRITGLPFFQCLISVERYLAVVYPLTFLKYRPLRYRLICFVIAWVTCFCSCVFNFVTSFFKLFQLYFISYFSQFFFFLSIQLFCCLAVLRALKQSGPGEKGKEREEENHMKRRAFHLILITTVCMFVTYIPQITMEILDWSSTEHSDVFMSTSSVCFLLSGLVQPLLFLYRVGKLKFFKCH